MKFKNMKIAITDEVHLKAVCDVLESMGISKSYATRSKVKVILFDEKFYSLLGLPVEMIDDRKSTTLTDLLAMRDQIFMESIR